jgi:hemolysin activation/secretion protein
MTMLTRHTDGSPPSTGIGVNQLTIAIAVGACGVFATLALRPTEAATPANATTPTVASQTTRSSASPHFDILEYRVLGNTVLTNRQIEGVLYPRLGTGKSFADVESARAALEAAYHALGYATVFVDIPPQQVSDGVVRLHITEGKLNARYISGAHYYSEQQLLSQLPATQPGTVLNVPELQRELNAVNVQTADRSVVPVLRAGPAPGTTDLALQVNDHLPLHGSLEVDNQYSPDTEPLRLTGALSYNNLFSDLDSIAAQYTLTPQKPSQVGVANIGYSFHPFLDGIRPSLSFTNSSSDVATIGTLGVLGRGQVIGGRLTLPVTQAMGDLQYVTLGIDYKHFRNTIALESVGVQIEPISYVNLSAAYSGVWRQFSPAGVLNQSIILDIAANMGPRGFANSAVDFADNRYLGRGNYAYLHTDVSYMRRLPEGVLLTLRAAGQEALDPLVVYEQQSFAGADGVRGYLEAEELGDTGIKGTVQLASPPLVRHNSAWLDGYVYVDAAHSHEIDALPGEPGNINLSSLGAGMDILPGHQLTGSLTWAETLARGARTGAHLSRLLFDLKSAF